MTLKSTSISLLAATAAVCIVVLANSLWGTIYDTRGFGDFLLLTGAAYRISKGMIPGVDFGHLYGGIDAQGVAAIMSLTGQSANSVDLFRLCATLIFSGVAAAILWRRSTFFTFSVLVAAIGSLLLSAHPLELSQPIISVSAEHSFLYNRIGNVAFLLVGLLVACRADRRLPEIVGGVLAGVIAVLALEAKPTFFVLMPAALVGLLLQRRLWAMAGAVLGAAAMLLLLDPTLARWLGSIAYSEAQLAGDENIELRNLLRKAVQIPLAESIGLFAVAAMIVSVASRNILSGVGLAMVPAAGLAMAASMGGNGSLGLLATPIFILLALTCFELARSRRPDRLVPIGVAVLVLILSLAVPQYANTIASIVEGNVRADRRLIHDGPFASYLSIPEPREAGKPSQYEMFAEGINVLNKLGASGLGIAADAGISFEYAVQGRPVAGFPLWQRASTPELSGRLSEEIDILMLSRFHATDPFQMLLRSKMMGWRRCVETDFWEIHVRPPSPVECPSPG